MLLFIKSADTFASKIVVPLARVYDIWASDCSVNINYDGGEVVEVEGTFQKKIESVHVTFDKPDDVDKIMRQFYKAVNAGSKAFYIGKD